MLDPVACAGMAVGRPRVELAALVELNRLLGGSPNPAHSQIEHALIREKGSEASQIAGSGILASADDPLVRQRKTEGLAVHERDKVVLALAQILMQAAGLKVEELDDDKR